MFYATVEWAEWEKAKNEDLTLIFLACAEEQMNERTSLLETTMRPPSPEIYQ